MILTINRMRLVANLKKKLVFLRDKPEYLEILFEAKQRREERRR